MSKDDLPSLVSTIKIGSKTVFISYILNARQLFTDYDEVPNPTLNGVQGGDGNRQPNIHLFDVKFYPFTKPGVDPVFAATGGPHTIVCRPCLSADQSVQILQWFRDEDERVDLNSIAWTQDPLTHDALLCVSGNVPKIKIMNVRTGKLVRTLTGHGSNINDLAISPLSKQLLASASEDYSVRLWHLDPRFEWQPTAVIFAGDGGHADGVMSIAFHPSGKYLISGGMDTRISLWAVPDLPNARTGTDKPDFRQFPHFTTTEVHSDIVDCIEWYGDLVLSKSAQENRILLWRIKGFSSSRPNPGTNLPAKKTPYPETRSAFGAGWQQLLSFDTPDCKNYYNRFGLFHVPFKHPVLAHANLNGRLFFWDLQMLEAGAVGNAGGRKPAGKRKAKTVASTVDSRSSDAGSIELSSKSSNGTPDLEPEKTGDSLGTPFKYQKAHKSIRLNDLRMANRSSWSVGGEWCVVSGGEQTISLLHR